YIPLAVMAQASITNTRKNHETDPTTGETVEITQRNNGLVFCCASIFLASKVNDNIGGFIQWGYDNIATTADGTLGGHSSIDNTDLKIIGGYSSVGSAESDLIFDPKLHYNPTVT